MKHTTVLLTLLLSLFSCSDMNAWFHRSPCHYPDARGIQAPGWICHSQDSQSLVSAVGFAAKSSAGPSFTKNMAIANARVKLAQRLQGQCGVRNVSDAMLSRSRVLNTQRSPRGAQYALIAIKPSDLKLNCR